MVLGVETQPTQRWQNSYGASPSHTDTVTWNAVQAAYYPNRSAPGPDAPIITSGFTSTRGTAAARYNAGGARK